MFTKMIPALVGASLLVAVTGCTDQIPAQQDPVAVYDQITVDSYSLQNDIVVQPAVTGRIGAGQLQVDINVRNKTDHDLQLDYKYYFVDAKGVPMDRDTSWQAVRIPRKGVETIEFKSLTASAADFRVELRRTKTD